MDLLDKILTSYPELTSEDFAPHTGSISLKDDGDGIVYLGKWDYSKPIPAGITLGKPTA